MRFFTQEVLMIIYSKNDNCENQKIWSTPYDGLMTDFLNLLSNKWNSGIPFQGTWLLARRNFARSQNVEQKGEEELKSTQRCIELNSKHTVLGKHPFEELVRKNWNDTQDNRIEIRYKEGHLVENIKLKS